ncbi:MAG: hypothetical protein MI861_27010, partial [Pirellulales bacterium]|nr:hypothetical protein [Pirellulales bacterium]
MTPIGPPMAYRFSWILALGCLCLTPCRGADPIVFHRDIRPILSEACFHCHGPDSATRQADLRLDVSDSAMSVIQPGDSENSELIRRILAEDPDQRMPPADSRKQLTAQQRQRLARWIDQGAPFEGHWAFTPPASRRPPTLPEDRWVQTPVDAFVIDRLRREGLQPSPPAPRETLIRRI